MFMTLFLQAAENRAVGCALTVGFYLATAWAGARFGLRI
jgi:hypothetical protein